MIGNKGTIRRNIEVSRDKRRGGLREGNPMGAGWGTPRSSQIRIRKVASEGSYYSSVAQGEEQGCDGRWGSKTARRSGRWTREVASGGTKKQKRPYFQGRVAATRGGGGTRHMTSPASGQRIDRGELQGRPPTAGKPGANLTGPGKKARRE